MNMKLSQLGLLKAGSRPGERRPSATAPRDGVIEQGSPNPRPAAAAIPATTAPQTTAAAAGSHDSSVDSDSDSDSDLDDDDVSIGYDSSSSDSSSRSDSSGRGRSSINGSENNEPPSVQDGRAEEHTEEDSKIRPDIPPEMLESIDIPLTSRDPPRVESSVATTEASTVASPVRQPAVDQSLSMFTQGFTMDAASEAPTEADNAQLEHREHISVDCSLSALSRGYTGVSTAPRPSHQTPTPMVMASLSSFTSRYEAHHAGSGADAMDNTRDSSLVFDHAASMSVNPAVPVDCSVSAFTTGYATETTPIGAMPPIRGRSTPQIEVAQSISVFTSGYAAAEGETQSNDTRRSVDVKMVAASLSSFIAGYESAAVSAQEVPEELATGDFSAGSAIAPLMTVGEEDPKNAELQYSSEEEPNVYNKEPSTSEGTRKRVHPDVMQSLSSFTAGYESFAAAPATASNDTNTVSTKGTRSIARYSSRCMMDLATQ